MGASDTRPDQPAEPEFEVETASRADTTLKMLRGTFVPGVYFSSGYSIWVRDFTSVPGGDPFSEVWIVTPDGERILYVDPEAAIETVLFTHEFDRIVGGRVARDQTSSETARLTLDGDDETNLEVDLRFEQTPGTRVLNAMSALTPKAFSRTRFGGWLGTKFLNQLAPANGSRVAGRFETGAPYRFETERMYVITGASATLNGKNLGTPTRAPQPVGFGDIKNMPLYMYAKAYLPVREPEPAETTDQS